MARGREIRQRIKLEGRREVEAELKKLGAVGEAALNRLQSAANRAQGAGLSRLDRALVGLRQRLDVLNARAGAVGQRFSFLGTQLAGAAGAIVGALSVRALVDVTDKYTELANILRVVSDEQADVNETINDLNEIANRTRTPLEAISTLYQRASIASKELGADQQEILRFTENIGLALAQQGGSSAAATGALLQLSQALGAGTVRAEEFNSILEGAFPIAQAAARGLDAAGGSVAKLRQLILAGQVTSQDFFRAILSQSDSLEEAFGKTVPTISQAFTVLNNQFTVFIGQANQASGVTGAIAQAILFLADNIDVAVLALTGLVGLFAVVKGFGLAKDLFLLAQAFFALLPSIIAVGAALLANPLFLIPTLIAAAVAAVLTFTGTWDEAWQFLQQVFSDIGGALFGLVEGIVGLTNEVLKFFGVVQQQAPATAEGMDAVTNSVAGANQEMARTAPIAQAASASAQESLKGIGESAQQMSQDVKTSVDTAADSLREGLKSGDPEEVLRTAFEIAKRGAKDVADETGNTVDTAAELGITMIRSGQDGSAAFQSVAQNVNSAGNTLDQLLAQLRRVNAEYARLKSNAASTKGAAGGGPVPGFDVGGSVRGPGTGTSDSILARLSNGEFVMRARAVQKWGLDFMHALNAGRMPKFNMGGLVRGLTDAVMPALPRFADGGLAVAGGAPAASGTPLTLNIGGEVFEGLIAPATVAEKLSLFASTQSVRRAGKKPSWYE